MVARKENSSDVVKGMQAIRAALDNFSEVTVLEWYKTAGLPIRKEKGVWIASRKKLEKWWEEFAAK